LAAGHSGEELLQEIKKQAQWFPPKNLPKALESFGAEFAIFDVFNVMHNADENDNSEMRRILDRLSQIQAAAGCGIGVVHHYSKASDPGLSLTQRLRGAGAIAGWCE